MVVETSLYWRFMKRSEMINILKRELSNASRFSIPSNGLVNYHSVYIDNLLIAIEKAGMLPPTIEIEPTFNKQFGKVKKNLWESEGV